MVAPSKLYQAPLNCVHCSQSILHPDKSCLAYFLNLWRITLLSNLKYFSPLMVTPLVLKILSLNRRTLFEAFKYYLQTALSASSSAALSFGLVCLLRNLIGKYQRSSVIFLPTYFGMQTCWLFPERTHRLFALTTTQAAFETFLCQSSSRLTRVLLYSKLLQTLIFMISSGIILHYKQIKQYNGFWFLQPYKVDNRNCNSETPNGNCSLHEGKRCRQFFLDGLKAYLGYGLALDFLQAIMKIKVTGGGRIALVKAFFANILKFRLNMTGFFLSYVGVYRITSCFLTKYCSEKYSLQSLHFVAACLGGISYGFLDRITFFTLSLVIAVQILWQQFIKSFKEKSDKRAKRSLIDVLAKIQFSKLIMPINVAYMAHVIIFDGEKMSSLGRGMINAITAYETHRVRKAIETYETIEDVLREAANKSIKAYIH